MLVYWFIRIKGNSVKHLIYEYKNDIKFLCLSCLDIILTSAKYMWIIFSFF